MEGEAPAAGEGRTRRSSDRGAGRLSTREQILEVALDLFTEQGYDQTSLREIAQRLGLTKAALYYHFSSKDEIFMALHTQLHEILDESVERLEAPAITAESWRILFDSFIEKIPANRKLILMHQRNRTAFDKLHHEDHAQEHADIEQKLSASLRDPSIPFRQRVRIGCAFAMVMGALLFGGDSFRDLQAEQLVAEIKSAVHDLLDRA